ncbi:MAG TPA: radical SAM protein, partial [Rhodocyclaceae bacterium]|nr:radical SAM protein [Rhodocyclaceae bacterium]
VFVNRRLGREFIPATTETFCIETSGACNFHCRFCAYDKKREPRVSMGHALFVSAVEQALELGYREFHLTPCTGDVFMDKHVFDKFAFLDGHPAVRAYHFFTNLAVLNEEQIGRLVELKKLSRMTISIYGHDEESFVALTRMPAKIYRRLLANLRALLILRDRWPFAVTIGFRSTFDAPATASSDILQLLAEYRAAGVGVHSSHGIYNNWGGYVTQEDVAGLNLRILSGEKVFKSGPCVKLFDSMQVTATGLVNGCSCRDVDATLRIGDLNDKPLREILGRNNAEYMRIIEEQQAGKFRPVCRSCDYYRSIYHQPSNYRRENIPTRTMAAFLDRARSDAR